jgi:glutathione synthetase
LNLNFKLKFYAAIVVLQMALLPLAQEEVDHLLSHALDFMYSRGAVLVAPSRAPADGAIHAPFSLLPFPFPAAAFDQAVALAAPFNLLIDAISRDVPWLCGALSATCESDAFTARLVAAFAREAAAEAAAPAGGAPLQCPLRLGLHRSDYMFSEGGDGGAPGGALKQVEINTVAASFGCLSTAVGELHAHLAARHAAGAPAAAAHFARAARPLAPSRSCAALAAALAAGHAAYCAARPALPRGGGAPGGWPAGAPTRAVAMVVQPGERNAYDQRALEHELWRVHGVPLLRVPLAALAPSRGGAAHAPAAAGSAFSAPALLLRSGGAVYEATVVYLRAGYGPEDYPSEVEWEGRAAADGAGALKCPCLGYQLAGAKKVQQLLACDAATLPRFLPDASAAAAVRGVFAGQWGFGAGAGGCPRAAAAAAAAARAEPGRFVLKPQREGGGHNLFGGALAAALSGGMAPEELEAHVLMERLHPAPSPCALVKGGAATLARAACELGVYGVFLGGGGRVLLNEAAGHLLRTKVTGTDEGGVALGFAVLDSPMLV